MHEEMATRSASDLAAAIRSRQISSPRAARAVSRPRRTVESPDQRSGHAGRRPCPSRRRRRRCCARSRRRRRATPRSSRHHQGRDRDRRNPFHRGRRRAERPRPTRDAPAVARLKAAGAIVFGKTNAPRWSGDIETFNEIFGGSSNPWNVGHITGGSSGGSAAAVAAGLTSFELGTDIGGSVRIPSHCCGVFGLKPSFGVVPRAGTSTTSAEAPPTPTSTSSGRSRAAPTTSTS